MEWRWPALATETLPEKVEWEGLGTPKWNGHGYLMEAQLSYSGLLLLRQCISRGGRVTPARFLELLWYLFVRRPSQTTLECNVWQLHRSYVHTHIYIRTIHSTGATKAAVVAAAEAGLLASIALGKPVDAALLQWCPGRLGFPLPQEGRRASWCQSTCPGGISCSRRCVSSLCQPRRRAGVAETEAGLLWAGSLAAWMPEMARGQGCDVRAAVQLHLPCPRPSKSAPHGKINFLRCSVPGPFPRSAGHSARP